MRSIVSLSFFASLFAALVACGGAIDGGGGGGNHCPDSSAVRPGTACSVAGQACQSNLSPECGAGGVSCTCLNGEWACATPAEGCAQPACPARQNVYDGAACYVGPEQACPSIEPIPGCDGKIDGYVSCYCVDGRFSCPNPGAPYCEDAEPPPPPPPPQCPAPDQVHEGWACAYGSPECAGNPRLCGQQWIYDYFDCQNGFWERTVSSGCAGQSDAGK